MRSLWNGMLSFGMVQVPIKLYPAIRDTNIHFHYLHKWDGGRIKNARVCLQCGENVEASDLVRGYELEKNVHVTLTNEDVAKLAVESTRALVIDGFIDPAELESVYFDKPYYLVPDSRGGHPYALLREALLRTGKVAVTRLAFHEREHLAIIKPEGRALLLNLLYFEDEIVSTKGLALPKQNEPFSDVEMAMAEQLIERMTEHFEPEKYRDSYRESLRVLLEKRHDGARVKIKPLPQLQPTEDEDLLEVLKTSIEKVAARRRRLAA